MSYAEGIKGFAFHYNYVQYFSIQLDDMWKRLHDKWRSKQIQCFSYDVIIDMTFNDVWMYMWRHHAIHGCTVAIFRDLRERKLEWKKQG